MENRLMEQIVSADEQFIQNIANVDGELSSAKQNISKGMVSL